MVPLLLLMSPRLSLTVFKADDSVLNDTKKRSRLSPQLFDIRQSFEAPLIQFFIHPPLLSSDEYKVKDGEPSDEELEYLSQQLGDKWEELGRRLAFDEAAITNFDENNKKLAKKAFKMLMDWKQKEGCQATYSVLNYALRHILVNLNRLAEQFCCEEIEDNASP